MTGIVAWAGHHARMILAFIVLTLVAGAFAYMSLPKEGEPDIEIPALFVSVPFPGISAEDAEKLLVRPMETELSDLDGLDTMSATAAEGYAGIALEFDFGWDKSKTIADVRDRMGRAEADFPEGADSYTITEINFSEFPILIVNLTGPVPERTLVQYAKRMQDRIEGLEPVLEAALTGHRDEMLEVIIDPLRLESYNVTAAELIDVVTANNQLVAAGEVETDQGAFSVKIPSSFDDQRDVMELPVKVNGDRVVTLGDLADIRLTFEDPEGTARFNGESTVALQVVKRKGFPIIDTVALVKQEIEAEYATWPEELQEAIVVGTSNDQSRQVSSMVSQLEGSVLTAIALVMVVVLAALGIRSALLVGFAIPTSFLLCFILLGLMGVTISNIVMFGLILAVGMLVDGAIVVVEYADRRIEEGDGPMASFVEAAQRMFWPIVSSTATTLCAFLPMLFWPGVAGAFMGMLPVTIIFVLSASLIVALIYLPVMGGVSGRIARAFDDISAGLRRIAPWWLRAVLVLPFAYLVFLGLMQMMNPSYLLPDGASGWGPLTLGFALFLTGSAGTGIMLSAARIERPAKKVDAGYRRTPFGHFTHFIAGNPVMPLVAVASVIAGVVAVFVYYGQNNRGIEFFAASEPEQAIIYVRARGNLSLAEKDALVHQAEEIVLNQPGVDNAFVFAGEGGLNRNTGGSSAPRDTIGQIQVELIPWDDRPTETKDGILFFEDTHVRPEYDGDYVLAELERKLAALPGIYTETLNLAMGPASAKPVHLRLKGNDFDALAEAAATVRAKFETMEGLADIEDTRPLPGIDWQIDVDVEKAGRYGADVATVGGMIQLVTRGILLDTMRVPSSDEEIEIRVRLPEQDRVLSTLDTLKVRTRDGLVPLSNFITREPVAKLAQIDRVDQQRYYDVKAAVDSGLTREDGVTITATERIGTLTRWLREEAALPDGVTWQWTGDDEEQQETGAFLGQAFGAALALMFIILLAQFNSFYNAVLVLLAVVMSTAGVLVGLLVMDMTFGMIMTGTGIVALAGIVVNNNIVLIDTYQEYARYMPRIEAIVRTAEDRIRPVILTTITTMAGLTPMMFAISLDFIGGGYTINAPTAQFWTNLATAVVFGLGIATVLTLVFTPAMLALRVWFWDILHHARMRLATALGAQSRSAEDYRLRREAKRAQNPEFVWSTGEGAWGAPDSFDAHRVSAPAMSSGPAPLAATRAAPPARAPEPPPATPESVEQVDAETPERGPGRKKGRKGSEAAE
ncbi:efflux RND transporter permease subunit [Celeribacter indicus]|uniref:Acriflavin resistance protein n=1 Tax=Celeribacter indicus TaxID=1208324 RepID=A0A0B5E1Y1_9RHOB|nr:efflux RND transporter permease subunit [Celeribacter indicus]AJE47415.1 acriflavin resistance protein [Celeribacter indicus]SDW05992.1 multidrug efflux pump [Celeribacter indicus]